MKKLLLFSLSVLFVSALNARTVSMQNTMTGSDFISVNDTLELYDTLGNIVNNGIIKINGSNPSVDALVGYIRVKNTTTTDMTNIFVRRIINQEVVNSANSFCFGVNCYGPMTNESTTPTEILAGVTDKSFYGDYYPGGNGGLTSITYEFFDNVTFGVPVIARATVEFAISATSTNEDKLVFKGPFPNPASQYSNFEYNLPSSCNNAQIIIRNMLGVEVENIMLRNRSGKEAIDVSQYASGIYFYTFIADGKAVQSRKMIVKH